MILVEDKEENICKFHKGQCKLYQFMECFFTLFRHLVGQLSPLQSIPPLSVWDH